MPILHNLLYFRPAFIVTLTFDRLLLSSPPFLSSPEIIFIRYCNIFDILSTLEILFLFKINSPRPLGLQVISFLHRSLTFLVYCLLQRLKFHVKIINHGTQYTQVFH